MRKTPFIPALAMAAVIMAGVLVACETVPPTAAVRPPHPLDRTPEWTTLPREDGHVHFVGERPQDVIYAEVRGGGAGWRQEQYFLLTDTYSFFRSRAVVTFSSGPVEPLFLERVLAPDGTLMYAGRCRSAQLSPVKKGSNVNGPFSYRTCRRDNGDHCFAAGQEIRDFALDDRAKSPIVLVEWLLCASQDREAQILAKFAGLRLRK